MPFRIVSSLARRARSPSSICANAAGPEFTTVRTAATAASATKPATTRKGQTFRKRANVNLKTKLTGAEDDAEAPPVRRLG